LRTEFYATDYDQITKSIFFQIKGLLSTQFLSKYRMKSIKNFIFPTNEM